MAALEKVLPGDAVRARVKWFNIPKGFGFVVPENESFDAFLHITTLKRAGVVSLGEGACLLCRIERTAKGAYVKEVVAILEAGALPEPIDPPVSRETVHDDSFPLTGTVKWYTPEKGFGFVIADDGLKDVFLRKQCLQRYGLSTIEPGTPLHMTVRNVAKGREVIEFTFLDEGDVFSESEGWLDPGAGNS